jgi:hypothetical protein
MWGGDFTNSWGLLKAEAMFPAKLGDSLQASVFSSTKWPLKFLLQGFPLLLW